MLLNEAVLEDRPTLRVLSKNVGLDVLAEVLHAEVNGVAGVVDDSHFQRGELVFHVDGNHPISPGGLDGVSSLNKAGVRLRTRDPGRSRSVHGSAIRCRERDYHSTSPKSPHVAHECATVRY